MNLRDHRMIRKKKLMILGIIVLAMGIFFTSHAFTKEIIIQDGDKQINTKVWIANVEGILKKNHITIGKHDKLSYPLETRVKNGMVIVIDRAHPVILQVNGKTRKIITANRKTKDILKEYNIAIQSKDRVEPSMGAVVKQNDTISIIKVTEKLITEKAAIPYQSMIKNSEALGKGKVNLIQKGQNGEKEIKYRVTYENGQEIGREFLEEKILQEPINEIIEQGTVQYIATSRGALRYKNVIRMTSTAYNADFESTGKRPGDRGYGITRSGTRVRPGVVAVDPREIPLGTKLYIKAVDGSNDYGFASAEDTGGAIKGKKIDLYFESLKDIKKHGKRKVDVYILE